MPCAVFSQNNHYSISVLFFQVIKLWAKACLCVGLSFFLLICIPILILLTLPFSISFLWALFFCKILCFFGLCPEFRFLEMKFLVNYLSSAATKFTGSSKSNPNHGHHHHHHNNNHHYKIINDNNDELIAKTLEDKQESVQLDPSELPSLYESDFDVEDDHHQEIHQEIKDKGVNNGMSQICTYEEGSWQILVSKPRTRREPQSRESGSEGKNGFRELEVENLEEILKFPDSHSRVWSDDHSNDSGQESPDLNEVTSDKVGADCVHGFHECWKLLVKFTKFEI
nr:dual specificity protein kinase pyk3-like isoform X1 [Malus domestica]